MQRWRYRSVAVGNADDVARAVVFLAGEYDGFITGATLTSTAASTAVSSQL